jgi:hypothetical protein
LVPFGEFENGANEATALRAHVASHTGCEAEREQQAHSRLVVGRSSSVDQLIWRKAIAEQSGVANLLQGHSIQFKLSASSNDTGQLVHEAEANVQSAESQCRDSRRGRRG